MSNSIPVITQEEFEGKHFSQFTNPTMVKPFPSSLYAVPAGNTTTIQTSFPLKPTKKLLQMTLDGKVSPKTQVASSVLVKSPMHNPKIMVLQTELQEGIKIKGKMLHPNLILNLPRKPAKKAVNLRNHCILKNLKMYSIASKPI
jgi:hypothetical protein